MPHTSERRPRSWEAFVESMTSLCKDTFLHP